MSDLNLSPNGAGKDFREVARGTPLTFAAGATRSQELVDKGTSEGLFVGHDKVHQALEEVFQKLFNKSAVQRTRYRGLKRNIDFLK